MEELDDGDPRQLGEYRLLRRLGAGGMGQVYLGRTAGGRTVAVKTVHARYAADQEFRRRFRNEVAAARQVGGRWTAPVLDADTEGPQPWVATGYVAGPSLAAAVRDFGPLPGAAVRSLGVGLAEALTAVHGRGLVHRDVKPSNVLLALDGPRLIDFGIARALDAATVLTQSGFLVGSPGYLSPEQAGGLRAGPASDVFSLGAVLAFAATGAAPFGSAVSAPVLIYRVLHEDPDIPLEDAGLRAILADCLARDPDRRPTPAQLRERLTAGDAAAPERLDRRDWLPPAVAGSLAGLAVELLDLDGESAARPAAPTGRFGPAQPWEGPGPRPAPTSMPTPFPTSTPRPFPTSGPPVPSPSVPQPPPAGIPAPAPGTAVPGPPPGAHPATPALPYPPPAPTPSRPARRGPGRGTLVVSVVLAAATAGTAVLLVARPDRTAGTGPAPTTAATQPSTAAPAPTTASDPTSVATPAGSVPEGFLGTWQGQLGSPAVALKPDFTITITQGRPADPIARIHNNTGAGTPYCDAVADLISATPERVVLRTAPMNALSGCAADPHDQVYTRNADGSLHLIVGGFSGELLKK
ncbi:protein kinase [Kitasatospora sp. NPDC004745]|uniref:serine/threonine-protein kinase n=1 Tax=Kitasatospora sp. NPDC004745 TaxID=3364019 RepID=UPI0036C04E5D